MHVLRRTTVATTVMLAAISLGACSSSGSASDSGAGSASGSAKDTAPIDRANWPAEVPTSGLVKGLELPLESYLPSYADQVVVDTALRTLQTRCMSEYGLTVDLPRPGANPPPYSNAVSIERRYGLSDRAQAQKYGYGLPKELTRSLESVEGGLSGIEVEVLTGRKKRESAPPKGGTGSVGQFGTVPEPARAEHNGKKLHEGGCAGWSKRRLKVNEGDAGFVSGLASTSLSESRPSKPVEKAFKSWSACMKEKGRKAADPYRAMEQGYADGDGTTKNAIELALDDIDCKEQTRLIAVWFKEESAVQKRLIEENKDQLAAVKKRMGEVLAAAKAVK